MLSLEMSADCLNGKREKYRECAHRFRGAWSAGATLNRVRGTKVGPSHAFHDCYAPMLLQALKPASTVTIEPVM